MANYWLRMNYLSNLNDPPFLHVWEDNQSRKYLIGDYIIYNVTDDISGSKRSY